MRSWVGYLVWRCRRGMKLFRAPLGKQSQNIVVRLMGSNRLTDFECLVVAQSATYSTIVNKGSTTSKLLSRMQGYVGFILGAKRVFEDLRSRQAFNLLALPRRPIPKLAFPARVC